ncbi:Methylthioribose-1-phosphate isomerase [Ceratocystis platani]|uniref:Methylthioribose-1-phosphate isomerase n=1 Tax=Ceratocystis fimbriata f. sp. platani TaxID=88771 RepID=A0A0F8B567_CERFI|nr:Methylthioribose-1-phosphate isomerase [Ceratocystis platani]
MPCLESVIYSRGRLQVLDQLRLPHEIHHDEVKTCEEAFDSIRTMRVRGAPAIAIVASLALAVELDNGASVATSAADAIAYIDGRLDYLKESRPTAVDLSNAISLLKQKIREPAAASDASSVNAALIDAAEGILAKDVTTNRAIGAYGAAWLAANATGHGTALGIIRSLHGGKALKHAFCTETRPYNQGSRLTAFELSYENIPSTLITDSMAAALFKRRKAELNISAVIVGADRVVRNGDTANKIGTYQLAILAKYHGIKFMVAAPTTSIDLKTEHGDEIVVEERKKEELTQISGAVVNADGSISSDTARVATADQRIGVWNPAFDVTPYELIDAIVTERGVVEKNADGVFDFSSIFA